MVDEKEKFISESFTKHHSDKMKLVKSHEDKVKDMLSDFQRDMQTIDLQLKKQTGDLKRKLDMTAEKLAKQMSLNVELKNLLQMAVKSDNRKEALLEEMKVSFEKEKQNLSEKANSVDKEKESVKEYK